MGTPEDTKEHFTPPGNGLRGKINIAFCMNSTCYPHCSFKNRDCPQVKVFTNQILALFPEWANANRYKSLEEVRKSESIWQQQIEQARLGYVKLAGDQSFPPRVWAFFISDDVAYREFLSAGWRKVLLEVKDGS